MINPDFLLLVSKETQYREKEAFLVSTTVKENIFL